MQTFSSGNSWHLSREVPFYWRLKKHWFKSRLKSIHWSCGSPRYWRKPPGHVSFIENELCFKKMSRILSLKCINIFKILNMFPQHRQMFYTIIIILTIKRILWKVWNFLSYTKSSTLFLFYFLNKYRKCNYYFINAIIKSKKSLNVCW